MCWLDREAEKVVGHPRGIKAYKVFVRTPYGDLVSPIYSGSFYRRDQRYMCCRVPTKSNESGFYAFKDLEGAKSWADAQDDVIYEVRLSGKVAYHRRGYRAQYMTIVGRQLYRPRKPKYKRH